MQKAFLFAKQTLRKITDPSLCVCVCVCVCVFCVCVCVCAAVHCKHGDCLRHDNSSRVNNIGLDLHSRSHRFYTKYSIISESVQAMPIT